MKGHLLLMKFMLVTGNTSDTGNSAFGTGQIPQWLRVVEDLSSVPSTQVRWQTATWSSSPFSQALHSHGKSPSPKETKSLFKKRL